MKTLLIFSTIVLFACTPKLMKGSGENATPPSGYSVMCDNSNLPECGGKSDNK